MKKIILLDENLYRKKIQALKRYFRTAYKYVIFELLPTLGKENKNDGMYEVELPTEDLFKKVYGSLILKFSVKDDVAIIEDILPNDILLECYMKNLPVYKGIPYSNDSELKKLKIGDLLCQKKNLVNI